MEESIPQGLKPCMCARLPKAKALGYLIVAPMGEPGVAGDWRAGGR